MKDDKREEKKSILSPKNLAIAVIAVSVLLCLACAFSDLKNAASNFSTSDDPTLEKIIGNAKDFGDALGEAKDEADGMLGGAIDQIAGTTTVKDDTNGTFQTQTARQEATVMSLKASDIYVLEMDGEEETVRLIGVETPDASSTREGEQIYNIITSRISKGDILEVEYDTTKADDYGRKLAYLYFDDGTMVQEWLLSSGYAKSKPIGANNRYTEKFNALQEQASDNKIGFWNGFFNDDNDDKEGEE